MDLSKPTNPTELFSAKDLVVVITGGGTGIGLAITNALAQTGASRIYILGRRLETLQKAASSINPSTIIPLQCDISDISAVRAAAEKVKQEVGYVDVLINNGGVSGPDHTPVHQAQTIDELQGILLKDWDGWATTYAINSAGVAGVSTAFLHLLDAANKRRGWESGQVVRERARTRDASKMAQGLDPDDPRSAQIITVSSIASFNRFITAGLAYSSSKAAATHVGKMLATLLAPWGIRSNVIAPGIYPSEMTEGLKDVQQWPPEKIPQGRQGLYEDMAGVILYLVGRSGAFVNGNVQVTDGGRLSVMPGTY